MSSYSIRCAAAILVSCFFFSCTVKTSRRKIDSSHLATIHDIRIAEGLNKTIIEIEADEPLLYTSFRLSNPDRLVVEMAEVSLGQYDKEIKLEEGPIRAIHPSPSGEIEVTRLEFELSGRVKTDIRPDGLSIVLEVTRVGKKIKTGQISQTEESPKGSFSFFENEQKKAPLAGKGNQLADLPVVKPPTPPLLVPPLTTPNLAGEMSPEKPGKTAKPGETAITENAEKNSPVRPAKKNLARKKETPLLPAQNVLSIRFEQGALLQLVVRSDGKLFPRIFYSVRTKKHLVIDLPGVKSKRGYKQIAGDGQLVEQVRFGHHPDKLRLVLDFNQRVLHSSEQIQKELKITIQKAQ